MRPLRRLAALAASLVAGLASAACGDPPPPPASGPGTAPAAAPLRIGLEPRYEPFEMTDASGAIVGFDVDLARGLAESLGREAVFVPRDFDALIPELQAGRIDVVCSGMSYLPERAEVIDFSRPYARIRMAVMVGEDRAKDVRAIPDLDRSDVVVAVQRGTSGAIKAAAAFPKAEIKPFDTEVDAANEVAAGRAHAFVYDMVSIAKHRARIGAKVRVLEGDLGSEVYCMGFAKGSPLVAPANRYLEEASKPGGLIDRLVEKWKPGADRIGPGGK